MWNVRGEEIVPPAETGPKIWVTLPRHNEAEVQMLEQWRDEYACWWVTVALPVWVRVQTGAGTHRAEETVLAIEVPAGLAHRVEGVSYTGVPVRRLPLDPRARLYGVQHSRYAKRPTLLHHASCWADGTPPDLDATQAVQALRQPDVLPCDICDPESHLHETRARAEPENPGNPA